MTHCRVPPEPSVRARAQIERSLCHSVDRCVRVEERQRPHTTYTAEAAGTYRCNSRTGYRTGGRHGIVYETTRADAAEPRMSAAGRPAARAVHVTRAGRYAQYSVRVRIKNSSGGRLDGGGGARARGGRRTAICDVRRIPRTVHGRTRRRSIRTHGSIEELTPRFSSCPRRSDTSRSLTTSVVLVASTTFKTDRSTRCSKNGASGPV
ncbi:hypothetical protein EVAR_75245_1 [Eumeta japonica]|uniref:Uncharacterized protein n=1 Tax=Eumeta variegata TaxID=151549 RepID=A0A4C1V9F9_EUMVA|nr:hypothetical protein EVAR_75245_1 [Eumeta japonica]